VEQLVPRNAKFAHLQPFVLDVLLAITWMGLLAHNALSQAVHCVQSIALGACIVWAVLPAFISLPWQLVLHAPHLALIVVTFQTCVLRVSRVITFLGANVFNTGALPHVKLARIPPVNVPHVLPGITCEGVPLLVVLIYLMPAMCVLLAVLLALTM